MSEHDYKMQFQVIARTPQGEVEHVVFHGPGRMGFDNPDQALNMRKALTSMDELLQQQRLYEIIPVAVAEDFDVMPTIEFEDETGLLGLSEMAEEKAPEGSGLN